MKVTFLILVALLIAGCRASLPDDSAIHSIGSFPLDDGQGNNCTFSATLRQGGGSLDVDLSNTYLLRFDFESTLEALSQRLERPASGQEQNDYTVQAVVATSFLGGTPSSTSPYVTGGTQLGAPERRPLYAVIRPGATLQMSINLMSSTTGDALRSRLGVSDSATLYVSFFLDGRLASGQNLKSAPVTFPITVYRSGRNPATYCSRYADPRLSLTGPCKSLPGQDGSIVACCADPAFANNSAVKAGCQ